MSFLEIIYTPFSYLMKGCLWLAGKNYVFALFFFALAIQIIFIPVYIKQQKAQISSAKVRPMEMAIREKYKGRTDRVTMQKMNMEIQEMYQKSGHSQFAGCLPMLITLPLILILYAIVRQPISYASSLKSRDADFLSNYSRVGVEFYQAEKEALIKESYETADDYNKAVKKLQTLQAYLGGKAKTETVEEDGKKVEKEVKTESGVAVIEFKEAGSNGELYLANLITDGRSAVQKNIDAGHLPADFMAKYDEAGLEQYADDLPNFHIFGLNILNASDFGENAWLLFVPVLVFLTQFFAIKLNRKLVPAVPGPNGKPVGGGLFMEVGMPLLSGFFAYQWPAAMGIYWIWRTLLDMVKTVVFAKAMPIPKVTQEQIDAAKKELKGSVSSKKKKRITIEVDEDDDSYDELVVKRQGDGSSDGDAVNRKPRRVEMLSLDDDEELPPAKRNDEPAEPKEGDDGKTEN
ncbi:MAG: membrane protein insertase YidC [Clostridia bacterium]|nr:membrane protein insertase YidC [Clostridia bacterium]